MRSVSVGRAVVAVLLSAWAPAASGAGGEGRRGFRFTLDGEAYEPEVLSLNGTPDAPRPGDVVEVEGLLLVLGPEGDRRLKSTPRNDGRLLLVAADGKEQVVGVQVSFTYEGDKKVVINPLAKLTDEQIRGLWGVRLDDWPEGIADKLNHLDPTRACVTITDRTAQGPDKRLPPLPSGLRYLCVNEHSSEGIRDYAALADQRGLRFLRLLPMAVESFDAGLLKASADLRWLELGGPQLANSASLASLPALRELRLPWHEEMKDISFVRAMKELRVLDIRRSAVSDLTPLNGQETLAAVDADASPVERLPRGPLPALRSLKVMLSKLSDDAVADFAKAHPTCQVWHRWVPALRRALAGATRLRVRTGGTCHRDIEAEKTLFEVKDAKPVQELVGQIQVDEPRSGGHCMCCGEPSFEFYQGEKLLLTLGFHHGRSLRWPDGWPGDAMLTPASSDFLCAWLSDHGVKGPEQERTEGKRQEAAARLRQQLYEKLIPDEVLKRLEGARSVDEAAAAFENGLNDPVARAALCLKLFGCDSASWNLYSGLDETLQEALLPKVGKERLAAAIRKVAADPAGGNGAARWLFGEGKWASLDDKAVQELVPALAGRALGHPREICRRRTMLALAAIKGDAAVKLLRSVLAGEITVQELPKGQQGEPGGMVSFAPTDGDLPKGCSDRACAARLLAKLGDRASLPTIQELAKAAKGEDRKALDEAIQILTGGR